jgi:hypothetical protein
MQPCCSQQARYLLRKKKTFARAGRGAWGGKFSGGGGGHLLKQPRRQLEAGGSAPFKEGVYCCDRRRPTNVSNKQQRGGQ